MARYDQQPIYLDLCKLLKEVIMAGYEESMSAKDRVDFLVPIKDDIKQCLRIYIRAYRETDPVAKYEGAERLAAEFAVTLCDIHIADDEHIWRGAKDEYGNVKCAKRIADMIPTIDGGIERWVSSMKKGRPAPETGCGNMN